MWFAIIGSALAVFALALIYLTFRAAKLGFLLKLAKNRRWLARLLSLGFLAVLFFVLFLLWDAINAVVCFLHLFVFWMICDLAGFVFAKVLGKKSAQYRAGIVAFVLCTLYLAAGWFAAHHVFETDYSFESAKLKENLRVVQISDSHIGATFDAEGFSKQIERINALSPDTVVITGDFVDDGTSRADLLGACEALGALKTKYGVYFVFGNHDRGYYRESARGWSGSDLRTALLENGVTVLEDKAVPLGGNAVLIGRKDRSQGARQTVQSLISSVGSEAYTIVLDHQPYDFESEAAAGADLVLCGHTHGGQFIPINHVGEWIGENDLAYGHERRENTDFIVSSGISNWEFQFKTGCKSEIVVIDLIAAH